MYNTKFILDNGKELYPGYLEKENREHIKMQYAGRRGFMRCGCKPSENLFYNISEDLRIYPEHNNYQHDFFCCRYKDNSGKESRRTAYIINEETGQVTAYTSFDPRSFNFDDSDSGNKEQDNQVPEEAAEMEEIVIEKGDETPGQKERKEPKLSLAGLVRGINVDAYTEKVHNNKMIENRAKFSAFVYYRMKRVQMHRTKKSIGELTLEKDGVRFIYLPFVDAIEETSNGISRCYFVTRGADGNHYKLFIYPKTIEKALKEYYKNYGVAPDENTIISGFQYLKKRKGGHAYKVLGRVHLFRTSDIGLYCRSMMEVKAFNELHAIVKDDQNIKFWIPPEDENIGAIISINGFKKKILLLFPLKKSERVTQCQKKSRY